MRLINYYATLGIFRDCSDEAIKSAYRKKARETHPDRDGNARSFAAVKDAYGTLRDPVLRRECEDRYRREAEEFNAVVCDRCFGAQVRARAGNDCPRCGSPRSNRTSRDFPRLERLKADLLNRISDAAIDLSQRIGEEIADATIEAVDRGVAKIRNKVRRP